MVDMGNTSSWVTSMAKRTLKIIGITTTVESATYASASPTNE